MIAFRGGRSSSRERRYLPQNEKQSALIASTGCKFKSDLHPLGILYQEVPSLKYPRVVLRKDKLSKSHSMTSTDACHKPIIVNKISSSLSKLRNSNKPEGQKETLTASASLPESLSILPNVQPVKAFFPTAPSTAFQEHPIKVGPRDSLPETDDSDFICAICLEILYRPRQLTCGHAFCLICLQTYSNSCSTNFTCPSCRQAIELPLNGVSDLPRNLNLEKIVEQLHEKRKNMALKAKICIKCHSKEDVKECHHCCKGWCYICLPSHMKDVQKEYHRMKNCLMESKDMLLCKQEEEETRFNKLEEKIKEAIEMKKEELIAKVQTMREQSQQKVSRLSSEVERTLNTLSKENDQEVCREEVWKQYKDASHLLESVSSSVEPRLTFDGSSLTLCSADEVSSGTDLTRRSSNVGDDDQDEEAEDERFIIPRDPGALYRSKNSFSKYKWGQNVCSRPGGIAMSPWTSRIYVTASDSCKIHIFELGGKQISSFGFRGHRDGGFMCPIGIAFSSFNKEFYITDKWKHCIHVFDSEGRFLRQMGKKGKGYGAFSSPEGIATDLLGNIYVADTCNDRVQVLDRDGVFLKEIGLISSEIVGQGRRYMKREFNEPVGVAVSPDGTKIYVSDSGNHRIRVFDGRTGERSLMFGSRGCNRGQFESPEGIAVDEDGFILVSDSGNGRVQIFRPNGRFVRVLGSKGNKRGEFGWVSGITLTKSKDIIVTDFKNNTLAVF